MKIKTIHESIAFIYILSVGRHPAAVCYTLSCAFIESTNVIEKTELLRVYARPLRMSPSRWLQWKPNTRIPCRHIHEGVWKLTSVREFIKNSVSYYSQESEICPSAPFPSCFNSKQISETKTEKFRYVMQRTRMIRFKTWSINWFQVNLTSVTAANIYRRCSHRS